MTEEKFEEIKEIVKKNSTQEFKILKHKVEFFVSKIKDRSNDFD